MSPALIGVVHVVVLLHGLGGHASDFAVLGRQILTWKGHRALIPTCNEGRTSDGIAQMAQRAHDWLLDEVKGSDGRVVAHNWNRVLATSLSQSVIGSSQA